LKPSIKINSKRNFKLSKRLQEIEQLAVSAFIGPLPAYEHIWDCCCDHGLLGFSLLSGQVDTKAIIGINTKIHFVDIVPELMADLDNKLNRFYQNDDNSSWETHCIDVAKLPLEKYTGKHLIIIAGIGGDLMIEFIEAIHHKHKSINIDFLLCPVHHQYPLRQKLIELDFSLKHEVLVEDNHRFYEILMVSSLSDVNNLINQTGNKIWLSNSSEQAEIAKRYLSKTLNHYQRMQQGLKKSIEQDNQQDKSNDIQHIIDAYQNIKLND